MMPWSPCRAGAVFGICFCFLSVSISGLTGSVAAQTLATKPPLGFETTQAMDRTLIDIVYRGQTIAVTPARFDNSTLIFEDPAGLTAILPGVREREEVEAVLSEPLATNANLVCSSTEARPGCGIVQPRDIALIFDVARLRAELFINPRYSAQIDPRYRFLPPPTIAPAVLSRFNARTAYDYKNDRFVGNHTVEAIAGRGRMALRGNGFADASGSGQVTAMYATHSGEDRAWSAGLIPPSARPGLARSWRMFGVRFGTLTDSRLDQDQINATPIEVSVSQSATIELQRDGQTLDVQQIEPGQTQIETQRLPSGSYTLDLIITEGGVTRTESRFFSTSSRLPPQDAPRWYIELGNAVPLRRRSDGFEDTDPPAIALGWAQRLGPNWGLKADGFFGSEVSFVEVATRIREAGWSGDVTLTGSDQGAFGVAFSGSMDVAGWQVRGAYRDLDPGEVNPSATRDTYTPFPDSFRQADLSLNKPLKIGRIGARGFYRETAAGDAFWFAGPYADLSVLDRDNWRLNLNARAELGADAHSLFLGLRLARNFGVRQRLRATSRVDTFAQERRATGEVTRQTRLETELRFKQTHQRSVDSELFAGVRYDDDWGARLGGRYRAPWVDASVDGRYNFQNQNTVLLGLSSGLVANEGGVSLTDRRSETGVRVSVEGPKQVPVSVLVNGAPRAVSETGRSGFVPLETYAIADIAIQPTRAQDLAYAQTADRFVTYPGNVMSVKRAVRRVTILVGQLLDVNGEPVANAVIKTEGLVSRTDTDGYFQIDAVVGQTLSAESRDGSICQATIPEHPPTERAFVDLGKLACR